MIFGSVEPEELSNIDFTLPADALQTAETLKTSKPTSSFDLRVGATKWGRKEWLGNLYPAKTDEKEFLREYVKHFDSILLNATFYQVYGPEQVEEWVKKVDSNNEFKFYPLLPQAISHVRRLQHAKELTEKHLKGIVAFGQKLGPSLLRLGDNFSPKSFTELETYLHEWPQDFELFVALSHKEWFVDGEWFNRAASLFKSRNVGWDIVDTPGRRDCLHMCLTIPKALIRFGASSDVDLDKKRLDNWATRIVAWKEKGLQSLGFFISGIDEENTPQLCAYIRSRISSI